MTQGPFEREALPGELTELAEATDLLGAASAVLDAGPSGPAGEQGVEQGGGSGRPPAKPSSRFLTIAVVVATLLAAIVGYMLNRASSASSNYADLAQQLGLEASAAQTGDYQQAETDYSNYLADQALQAKASAEMFESYLQSPNAIQWADLYTSTVDQVRQDARLLPADMRPGLPDGNPDPNFPQDFFAARAEGATTLQAESDGYNDASGKWAGLATRFTAIVTLLAVALFLFGSAFTLYGASRVLFAVVGVLLVLVGSLWGGFVGDEQPGTPSLAAARDYARGVVAAARAVTPSQYQPAIDDFEAAITARPDDAQAYAQLADAEVVRGSQELGGGFISNTSAYWQERAAHDEAEAYDLGDRDAGVVWGLGWDLYELWLMRGGRGSPPADAVSLAGRFAQLDPTNPVSWMNLGLMLVADGEYGPADRAYEDAAAHMLYADVARRTPQAPTIYSQQQAWLAGGVTDLEDLATSAEAAASPGMRSEIDRMKGILIESFTTSSLAAGPAPAPLHFDRMSGLVNPNLLALEAYLPRSVSPSELSKRPMTVIWFERAGGSSEWNAIPETTHAGPARDFYSSDYRDYFFGDQFLEDASQCLPERQYKAEIYLDGSLAGTYLLEPGDRYYDVTSSLAPALASSMNVGACVPSSWHMRPLANLTVPVFGTSRDIVGKFNGFETAYASPDGTEGVYLFRLYPLRSDYAGGPAGVRRLVENVRGWALTFLEGHGLPADITSQQPSVNGFAQNGSWMLLTDAEERAYESPSTGVEAIAGAGVIDPNLNPVCSPSFCSDLSIARDVVDDDGIAVTVVYGPASSGLWRGEDPVGSQVFGSSSLLTVG